MMPDFTLNSEAGVQQDLQADFDCIVDSICQTGIRYHAVYLIGSFGRGEGAVRYDGERWRGVNDYDICVITSNPDDGNTVPKSLAEDLALRLKIDLVDLMFLPREWLSALPATMLFYDLKYGSRLLDGCDVLDELPSYTSRDIPAYEFLRLLCNRAAGLLTANLESRSTSRTYRQNQIVKACIAVGDVAVYLKQKYHPSYLKRSEMFESAASAGTLPFHVSADAVSAVCAAYAFKLHQTPVDFDCDENLLQTMIREAFFCLASQVTGCTTTNFLRMERRLASWYDNRSRENAGVSPQSQEQRRRAAVKRRILFGQPFFYCQRNSSPLFLCWAYLMRFGGIPGALAKSWSDTGAAELWEDHKP